MKKFALSLILGATACVASAQVMKFGHINSQELLEAMPQRDSAMKVLDSEMKLIETQMEELTVEINKKYQDYLEQKDKPGMTDLVRKNKEMELQQMQERRQSFQETAQQNLQQRQTELIKPIMDKAKKAIEAVGKEEGLVYVFDVAPGVILYQSDKSIDIMPKVKAKLRIPAVTAPKK
jgi:outer membrane protein